jgi:hypothetical protein
VKSWWYRVSVHKSRNLAAKAWCQDQFGARWFIVSNPSGVWNCLWRGVDDIQHYEFSFAKQEDAVAFALKWS